MFKISQYPRKPLSHFCHVTDVFSAEEIEKIHDMEDLSQFMKGAVGVGRNGNVDSSVRESDIMWIHPEQYNIWLFEKFGDLVSHINYDNFMYDIVGFDAFQYTVYTENGQYNWHADSFTGYFGNHDNYERKISATILLSDSSEFDGGEFEVIIAGTAAHPTVIPAKRGDVIFFDSSFPHRVRPVTKGIRKSLVAWILGKR